jgi:hypothetical protein
MPLMMTPEEETMNEHATPDYPQTNGGRMLKRGYTFDHECHRTTYRLGKALALLRLDGIEPTFPDHDGKCILHPDNRSQRCFGHTYYSSPGCPRAGDPVPTWPEYVTGRMFDLAYQLADEMQTQRGNWHQREINRERAARS